MPTPFLAPWGTTWMPSAAVHCPPARSALQVSWFRCAMVTSSCPLQGKCLHANRALTPGDWFRCARSVFSSWVDQVCKVSVFTPTALQLSWFRCARSVSLHPLPSCSDEHLCFPMPRRVYCLGIISHQWLPCTVYPSGELTEECKASVHAFFLSWWYRDCLFSVREVYEGTLLLQLFK